MKKNFILLFCLVFTVCYYASAAGDACFVAKVVDEDDKLMPGAPVGGSFHIEHSFQSGVTETNGNFQFAVQKIILPEASFHADVPNYYRSIADVKYQKIVAGRWQPWNPVVTAVVRRIVNPIPMYAKRIETVIPAENVILGFDLITGDWVAPYGSGQTPDFLFCFTKRISGPDDFEGGLVISFTNTFDGILENKERSAESVFHLPRYAPNASYETNWTSHISEDPKTGRHGDLEVFCADNPNKSYFFRTRSKQDVN